MDKPDPEDEFRRDPQFGEVVKTAMIGVALTLLCLLAYFGWAASH